MPQRHVIKQCVLDFQIGPGMNPIRIQNQVSALVRNQVVLLIQSYCNQFSNPDTIHRIDQIEIDLGEIELSTLEPDLIQAISEEFFPKLSARLSRSNSFSTTLSTSKPYPTWPVSAQSASANSTNSGVASSSHEAMLGSPELLSLMSQNHPRSNNAKSQNIDPVSETSTIDARLELFDYFLKTGRLPWWSESLDSFRLEEQWIHLAAVAPQKLIMLMHNNLHQAAVVQRVLYQFSENMLQTLSRLLAPRQFVALQNCATDLQRLIPFVKSWQGLDSKAVLQRYWQGIFLQLVSGARQVFTQSELGNTPQHQDPARSSRPPWVSQPETEEMLQAGLRFLAAQFMLEGQEIWRELLVATETLTTTEGNFVSNLPAMLRIAAPLHAFKEVHKENFSQPPSSRRNDLWSHAQTVDQASMNLELTLPSGANSSPYQHLTRCNTLLPVEDIFVQNAGLVLLWPFLNRFFESLSLVQEGRFHDPEAAYRGVLLLQYLVTTAFEAAEPLLPLNKLLCGLDVSGPVPAQLVLTAIEQAECEQLLTAVIANWVVLKQTSIGGFRESFLQREGVLKRCQDGWTLLVEPASYDVLLEHIPWSIRVVKLPWMNQLIQVFW